MPVFQNISDARKLNFPYILVSNLQILILFWKQFFGYCFSKFFILIKAIIGYNFDDQIMYKLLIERSCEKFNKNLSERFKRQISYNTLQIFCEFCFVLYMY